MARKKKYAKSSISVKPETRELLIGLKNAYNEIDGAKTYSMNDVIVELGRRYGATLGRDIATQRQEANAELAKAGSASLPS